MYSVVKR